MKTRPDDASRPAPQNNSPFWALLGLFLALGFLQAAYLIDDYGKRAQVLAALAQIQAVAAKARTINQTTEAVSRDLIALSARSPEAEKIVAEFNIRRNKPVAPPE
jgi:hypothetical protein